MSDQFKRLSKVLAKSFSLDGALLQTCFRVAEVDEIPRVSALRREVFGNEIGDDDEAYLKWRYFDRDSKTPTLWVFEYDNNIIAALGTEPVELWHSGKVINAIRNMDAIVDPIYNNRGLGAWMTLAMQKANDCILVTGGNENSSSMLAKLFFALNVRKTYKMILRSQHFLRNKIHNRAVVGTLSPVVDMLLAIFLRIRLMLIRLPQNWELANNQDIQSLLPSIRGRVGVLGQIKVLRTADYLNWRYAQSPCSKFNVVSLFEGDVCLGYMIYICADSFKTGIAEAFIMDWDVFNEPSKALILASLFKTAVIEIKARGVDEITMELNDRDSINAASKSGFIYRYDNPNFYVFHKSLPLDDSFYSSEAWYHSLGDSDNL